jgi:DNA-binding transcriptional regulator YhcF (GntR family)
MTLDLQIDRNSDIPVYRQLIEKLTVLVRAGTLKPGDRLPPERQLSADLGIARGTITKAYLELGRMGVLEVAVGRGSFVSSRQDVIASDRKEQALEKINALVNELAAMRFTHREIKSMVDLVVLEREEQLDSLSVAVVDCNPEALNLLYRQLGILARINIKPILLDDLSAGAESGKRLAGFDLIVTTSTHYSEVLGMVPDLKDRLLRVVVSPSQETIIDLAVLKPMQTIGILHESRQFLAIVRQKLDELRITNSIGQLDWPWEIESLEKFLANKDVLIVPSVFPGLLTRETAPILTLFNQAGGRIIKFDYQIERGSLVYIEERIKELKGQ